MDWSVITQVLHWTNDALLISEWSAELFTEQVDGHRSEGDFSKLHLKCD
jgi:hypothetical protein